MFTAHYFLFFAVITTRSARLPPPKIGGIFDHATSTTKAFILATQANSIEGVVKIVPKNDPFRAINAAQELIGLGVLAILGPSSRNNFRAVHSICDEFDVPLIDVTWNSPSTTINPYPKGLNRLYFDVLKMWHFDSFFLLYGDEEGALIRAVDLVQLFRQTSNRIVLRRLDKEGNGNYRPTFKEVWRSKATYIVIDCDIAILEEVLRQAQQIGLMTCKNHFFLINPDLQTLDLASFQYSETNITGVRVINPASKQVQNFSYHLFKTNDTLEEEFGIIAGWKLQLAAGLILDSVTMLRNVFENISSRSIKGSTLLNLVKGFKYEGITGMVGFDILGFRSQISLDVIELKEGGITKVGFWNTSQGLTVTRFNPAVQPPQIKGSLTNKTFRIITALTEPYGMRKESSVPLIGNDRYEGFGIDLIEELARRLGFNYTFIIREDKKNGDFDQNTGRWTGMIGDVISGRADLAITDLTITSERANAVDFSTTFMSLGVSILYQKAKKAPPSFFSFADPFSLGVWKLLGFAFLGVSLALFVLGRLSPGEWHNLHPCLEEPDFLQNQLSLRNCFWFTAGSLMQQGSDIAPIAFSTRMVAGFWWFFTLIMVSSYTANLAAFLTTETPNNDFNNVFELVQVAEEKGIKFGAKINGSTAKFFRDSTQIEEYQRIHQYMKAHETDVMVKDNKLGVDKAESQNYAFFMETTSIEYETQRRCSLTQIGGSLDEKGYGIAMRKNSSYRFALSTAILKLQEDGVLAKLKRKWWEERRGGGQCPEDANKSTAATPLNLKNVGGVFWVTIIGSLLAVGMVVLEMVLHTIKQAYLRKTPFRRLLREEINFYFKKTGLVKPVFYTKPEAL